MPVDEHRRDFFGNSMKSNRPQSRSTAEVAFDFSVKRTLNAMMHREPAHEGVGLKAAGLDPAVLVLALLGIESPAVVNPCGDLLADPFAVFPEAAKRKAVEADEDADDDDDDEADDDEEEEETADEDEEDLDEDEEEEEDDDEEEEEDDEFDDPDDDDDYDDDDDEEDFDEDE